MRARSADHARHLGGDSEDRDERGSLIVRSFWASIVVDLNKQKDARPPDHRGFVRGGMMGWSAPPAANARRPWVGRGIFVFVARGQQPAPHHHHCGARSHGCRTTIIHRRWAADRHHQPATTGLASQQRPTTTTVGGGGGGGQQTTTGTRRPECRHRCPVRRCLHAAATTPSVLRGSRGVRARGSDHARHLGGDPEDRERRVLKKGAVESKQTNKGCPAATSPPLLPPCPCLHLLPTTGPPPPWFCAEGGRTDGPPPVSRWYLPLVWWGDCGSSGAITTPLRLLLFLRRRRRRPRFPPLLLPIPPPPPPTP